MWRGRPRRRQGDHFLLLEEGRLPGPLRGGLSRPDTDHFSGASIPPSCRGVPALTECDSVTFWRHREARQLAQMTQKVCFNRDLNDRRGVVALGVSGWTHNYLHSFGTTFGPSLEFIWEGGSILFIRSF